MDLLSSIDLLGLGTQLASAGLVLGAFGLFLAGGSGALGGSFRSSIEPLLGRLREQTTLSRSDLADATILLAIVFATSACLIDRDPFAALIAVGLWLARPSIRHLTREENRLMAKAGHFSIDLVIGLYTPVMLAQFLVADILLGACLLSVVISLSWPAGGGGSIPGRRWQLVPVKP